jgi:hypothetical protein
MEWLRMRWVLKVAWSVCLFSTLAACSDDKSSLQQFETKGLVAPSSYCASDPRDFADAQKIRDIDLGNGCFVHNAYQVRSVSGVAFNKPGVMNCNVVTGFAYWLDNSVQPAAENAFGEKVVSVVVPSSYACRPRNNIRGGKLSEHGMGNAIDVSTFVLESGRQVSVLEGWRGASDEGRFLRQIRGNACGTFKTVLGPGSDAHHKDHLHMDLQRHRSGGTYCR